MIPEPLQSETSQAPARPKVVISMDLGSDSTVVYIKSQDLSESEASRVELQYFLPALARKPLLLKQDNEQVSHRLRSRYLVTDNFRSDGPLVPRSTEFGYDEILPADHATLPLVDYDSFSTEVRNSLGESNLTRFARNKNRALFQFVVDQVESFALGDLLPNAKLVFQSGLKQRSFRVTYEQQGEEKTDSFDIHPLEMIQNQICLILENFVRHHPVMKSQGRPAVDWKDCTLILTVPNTYSPFHRELLASAISEKLGCQVQSITESDAIVFHYYASNAVNRGLNPEALERMVQQYLTIDIGKGTTDLTLMSITLRKADPAELQKRGLSNPNARLPHVYVSARTGRPSGGAKLTYILAEYLETLVDSAVAQGVAELVQGIPVLPRMGESPIRFTVKTRNDINSETVRDALLNFEAVCEAHKRTLDTVELPKGKAEFRFKELRLPEADAVGRAVAEVVVQVMDPLGNVFPAHSYDETQESAREGAIASIQAVIKNALQNPDVAQQVCIMKGGSEEPWQRLQSQIQDYVYENVDQVLMELARAHIAGVTEEPIRTAAEALDVIAGEKHHRWKKVQLPEELRLRTHVIIAGQGSQFKPILLRFQTILGQARNLNISGMTSDDGKPVQFSMTQPNGGSKKSFLDRFRGLGKSQAQGEYFAEEDRVVCLSGSRLKDGCAHGALSWWLENPVQENPNFIHGQIVVRRNDGSATKWLDMDALNESPDGELISSGDYPSAWIVYYYPCRGQREEDPHEAKATVMATVPLCESFRIRVISNARSGSQIEIVGGGIRRHGRDDLYGMNDAKHLWTMLWPTDLPSKGEKE